MPGFDWKVSIEQGMQASGGIVVVVSPSSVKSPHVADEVRQAVGDGKPVFLAIAEATPLRLAHAPEMDLAAAAHSIIDMRGDFRAAMQCLLQACQSDRRIRDPIPIPRLIPGRYPRHVAEVLVASCLLLVGEGLIWGNWLTSMHFPWKLAAARLNFVSLTGILFWQVGATVAFLRRQLTPERFATHWLYILLGLVYAVFWQRLHVPGSAVNWWLLAWFCGITLLTFYRLFWSQDLLRWKRSDLPFIVPSRKGQLEVLTNRISKAQMESKQPSDPRPYVYSLLNSPLDEPVARIFRKFLNRCPNVFEQGASAPVGPFQPVNWHLLLVTNRLTPVEWEAFESLSGTGKLYMLATPTRVPSEVVARSMKLQWVDLRSVAPFQIGFLLLYLRGVQEARLKYASNYVPLSFDSLKGPNGLSMLAQTISLMATWSMACGLLAIISPATTRSVSQLLPLAVVLSIWQFSIVHTLYQRTRTLVQLSGELVSSLLFCYLIGVDEMILNAAPVNSSYSAGIPFMFDRKYILLSACLFVLTVVMSFWHLADRWFPVKGCRRATPGSPTHSAIAKGQLYYLLLAICVTAYMLANKA